MNPLTRSLTDGLMDSLTEPLFHWLIFLLHLFFKCRPSTSMSFSTTSNHFTSSSLPLSSPSYSPSSPPSSSTTEKAFVPCVHGLYAQAASKRSQCPYEHWSSTQTPLHHRTGEFVRTCVCGVCERECVYVCVSVCVCNCMCVCLLCCVVCCSGCRHVFCSLSVSACWRGRGSQILLLYYFILKLQAVT